MICETDNTPQVSASEFITAFRTAAETLKADLSTIWKLSGTDKLYTNFMATRVFPATARSLNLHFFHQYPYRDGMRWRSLDGIFHSPNCAMRIEDILVAIELENKEQGLSEEINKLALLRSGLSVIFFYSNENRRERRIREIQQLVASWDASHGLEFLVMWNQPLQEHPHWQPFVVTCAGIDDRPRFTIHSR